MNAPTSSSSTTTTTITTTASAAAGVEEGSVTAARSSMIQSIKGCGWSAFRIDKETLRRRIIMPQYLRLAIRRAINSKDIGAGVESADLLAADEVDYPPEYPMIVFVNSKSGGRHGPRLKLRLQQLMGEEQNMYSHKEASWRASGVLRGDSTHPSSLKTNEDGYNEDGSAMRICVFLGSSLVEEQVS